MEFITSDTHFFHKNILKYQKKERPFDSVEEMNDAIVTRWNQMIRPTDTVYHLGDVGFANPKKVIPLLERMNGKITLILGNHDKGMTKNSDFRNRFELCTDYLEIKRSNTKIVLCHYPIYAWNMVQYGALHFYGHTHGAIPFMYEGYSLDVGLDTNDCYPYNLELLIQELADIREDKNIGKIDPRDREERNE